MEPIGYVYTGFPENFGVPRQSEAAKNLPGRIVMEDGYGTAEAFRGIEGFSHIWVIWLFSGLKRESWRPTVRPPKLGGNRRMGVFATRSPYRPNPIGLTCVRLDSVGKENGKTVLYVTGVDMRDGTPVIDIKPYLPSTDSIPDATPGFTADIDRSALEVVFSCPVPDDMTEDEKDRIRTVLQNDPRPGYSDDPDREYRMTYGKRSIAFTVSNMTVRVLNIESIG